MSSVDDVIAGLEQAKQKLIDGKANGLRAAGILNEARDSVMSALGRSSADSQLVADMAAKEKALKDLIMGTDVLIGRIEGAIAEASSIGNFVSSDGAATTLGGSGSSGDGSKASPGDKQGTGADMSPLGAETESSAMGDAESIPDWVPSIATEIMALMPRGKKNVGVLTRFDGKRISGHLWSGEKGPGQGAPGLRRDDPVIPWHMIDPATSHVEGHATAFIRKIERARKPTEPPGSYALVISKRPCPGKLGCHAQLAGMLPKGVRFTVYVASHDRPPKRWGESYVGNGRGVAL